MPLRKWLGSPPFISHKKANLKGNNPILTGLAFTMVIDHLRPSWGDPPSSESFGRIIQGLFQVPLKGGR